jgi:hypothetical protein
MVDIKKRVSKTAGELPRIFIFKFSIRIRGNFEAIVDKF